MIEEIVGRYVDLDHIVYDFKEYINSMNQLQEICDNYNIPIEVWGSHKILWQHDMNRGSGKDYINTGKYDKYMTSRYDMIIGCITNKMEDYLPKHDLPFNYYCPT